MRLWLVWILIVFCKVVNNNYLYFLVTVDTTVWSSLNSCSPTVRLAAELWNTIPPPSTCVSLWARPSQGLSLWVCQSSTLQWLCSVWFSPTSPSNTGEEFCIMLSFCDVFVLLLVYYVFIFTVAPLQSFLRHSCNKFYPTLYMIQAADARPLCRVYKAG